MRDLLGGKGAGCCRDDQRRDCPCPPVSRSPPRPATPFTQGREVPRRSLGAGGEVAQGCREDDRQGIRRPAQSAARQRSQRREVLDAGNDGHGPQPGPQLGDARGARHAHQGPALRARRASPVHPALQQDRPRHRRSAVRGGPRRDEEAQEGEDRRRPQRVRARGADRRVPGDRQAQLAHGVPRGPDGAAARRHRRRVRVVEQQAGDRLPQLQPHTPRPRHGGQRSVDGLRQHG